jgi:aryl-alcohol dehydrogenase-like predicted oxidoreductase
MAQPAITAPIASASNVEQLVEITKAAMLKLDGPTLELLNAASRED